MKEINLFIPKIPINHFGYRDVLREILTSESKQIVLDCEKKILAEVLKQSQQVGLINDEFSILLTSLDAHTIDLDDYKVS